MGRAEKSMHDKEMASRLKREGDERTTQKCPVCYAMVMNNRFGMHIMGCKSNNKEN